MHNVCHKQTLLCHWYDIQLEVSVSTNGLLNFVVDQDMKNLKRFRRFVLFFRLNCLLKYKNKENMNICFLINFKERLWYRKRKQFQRFILSLQPFSLILKYPLVITFNICYCNHFFLLTITFLWGRMMITVVFFHNRLCGLSVVIY